MNSKKDTRDMTTTVRILFEISNAVNTTDCLDDLYPAIHISLDKILNLENFAVVLYHPEKDSITFPYFVDEKDPNPGEIKDIGKKQSLTARVINAGKPLIFYEEDLTKPAAAQAGPLIGPLIGSVCKVWAGAPLKLRGRVMGALVVQSYRSKTAFKKADLALLNSVAEFIAVAIERKQAEKELQASEAKYRDLFDTMPNGFYTASPDGYYMDANPAFVSMLGYAGLEELKSVHIPAGIREPEPHEIHSQQKPQEFINGQEIYQVRRKDGQIIWVEDNARYIKKEEGVVLLRQGICRDITRRKKIEDALHESESRFRAVFDHSHDAIFIHEPDGRLIDVNKTMLRMFDVSREEALVYTVDDYTGPEVSMEAVHRNWARVMAGEDLLFPWQARRPKDGSLFDVEIYLTRIVLEGRPLILFNIRDITEQKLAEKALRTSEEKYRLLFENSVEGIFQTTPDAQYLSVNPSFLKLFGFGSREELLGHFKNIGNQYVNPGDREKFKKIIESEDVVRDFETRLLKKDGTPVWVCLNARAVRDDRGVPLYYEGFMQDITERKQSQDELYRVSIHDHLTGICNRRYVFERLNAIIEERQREIRDFSLSIIDLDFFKKINDTHGHPAGDFILREFAAILSAGFRPYDLVGRYGGEEFIVVTMNTDIRQIHKMLERLREIVRDRIFEFGGTQIRVAFSAGIANTGEPDLEITVEALIRKADQRLYLAKQQGRDRIVYESSTPGTGTVIMP
jgi:diguanylate cyclase (GGDEF)-like protein/PAS domain S-box-containing protein